MPTTSTTPPYFISATPPPILREEADDECCDDYDVGDCFCASFSTPCAPDDLVTVLGSRPLDDCTGVTNSSGIVCILETSHGDAHCDFQSCAF